MNVFISGGAKNGKSFIAQKLAKDMAEKSGGDLCYIATMIPKDQEDRDRIERHVKEREGWGFATIERPMKLAGIDMDLTSATCLVDSVTALLSNVMFTDDGVNRQAGDMLIEDLRQFVGRAKNTVFVSDYIYGDPGPFEELTELYRRELARVDNCLADICDRVYEVTAGKAMRRK